MCRFVTRVLLVLVVVAQNTGMVVAFQNVPANGKRTVNDKPKSGAVLLADNPFVAASKLDLHAPEFDAIRVEHFLPAFMAGIAEQLDEMKTIAGRSESPTFENTIVAYEESGGITDACSAGVFKSDISQYEQVSAKYSEGAGTASRSPLR